MDLPEIFKALGDPTRLRILSLVARKELCVCMIAEVLNMRQPTVSKHLNRLRFSNIVKCRKLSQWCFYRMNESFGTQCRELLLFLEKKWGESPQYHNDVKKLDELETEHCCCQQLLIDNEKK